MRHGVRQGLVLDPEGLQQRRLELPLVQADLVLARGVAVDNADVGIETLAGWNDIGFAKGIME